MRIETSIRRNLRGRVTAAAAVVLLFLGGPTAVRAADGNGETPDAAGPPDAHASGTTSIEASLQQKFGPPDAPRAGTPIHLELTLRHPRGTEARLEPKLETSRWNLVDTKDRTTTTERRATTRWTLTFQIFRVGETTLSPLDVVVTGADGTSRRLATEPVEIRIRSALSDDEKADWKGPPAPATLWRRDYTLLWIGGGAGAVLLIALFWFGPFRSRQERDEPAASRPPEEVALQKLRALRESDLVERGEHMVFYVRMSEAVRRFLGERFGFPGTEWTTAEILDRLELLAEHYPLDLLRIGRWMRRVDLVKFSGRVPSPAEAHESLDDAIEIVESTDPIETGGSGDAADAEGEDSAEEAEGDAADETDSGSVEDQSGASAREETPRTEAEAPSGRVDGEVAADGEGASSGADPDEQDRENETSSTERDDGGPE